MAAGEGGTVTFGRSGTTVEADGATPILTAAEDAGVLMPSGCRMGICYGCVLPLREGAVRDLRTGEITTASRTVRQRRRPDPDLHQRGRRRLRHRPLSTVPPRRRHTMTVLQKKTDNPIAHLTPEDIETLGVELDAIRQSIIDSRGAGDAAYIRKVIDAQRKLELGSRALLLASMFPPAWVVGTAGLSVAKIIENMEIGHNVMHGQWDWMRDPKIHSTTWEWDNASPVRAVEALAQRAAPHVHERHRQGQRPRLRHHAGRRGPALGPALPRRSRCGTSSTPASSSTASRPTTSSSARTSRPRSAAPDPEFKARAKQVLKKIRGR